MNALRPSRWSAVRLWRIGRREPRLVLLLLDNLVTTLGASFTLVALPFLVMRLSGRALDLGVTTAIEALPSLCFLLVFPRFLDRVDPLRVLWLCRLLFVGINVAICSLTYFDLMSIRIVYFTAMLGGIVWAVAYPAGRSVFSLYVRKGLVPAGNAVFALISGLATITLPLAAGSLVLASRGNEGLAVAFGVDAVCVALSLPLLAAVGRRGIVRRERTADASPTVAVASGVSGIPRSFYAYLLASSIVVFGPMQILLPVILVARHDARYLLIYVAQFAGVAVAAALAARVGPGIGHVVRRMLAYWAIAAFAYLLLSGVADLPRVLVAFFLLAGASTIYGVQSQSWLQRNAPARDIGREMTWFSAVTLGATPVAALLTGALVDAMGLSASAGLLAASVVVATALGGLYQWHRFRHGGASHEAIRVVAADID